MSGDGGPAFPHFTLNPWGQPYVSGGMSLRDYFAAKALCGILTSDANPSVDIGSPYQPSVLARNAYWIADAMLAERAKAAQPSPASSSP